MYTAWEKFCHMTKILNLESLRRDVLHYRLHLTAPYAACHHNHCMCKEILDAAVSFTTALCVSQELEMFQTTKSSLLYLGGFVILWSIRIFHCGICLFMPLKTLKIYIISSVLYILLYLLDLRNMVMMVLMIWWKCISRWCYQVFGSSSCNEFV